MINNLYKARAITPVTLNHNKNTYYLILVLFFILFLTCQVLKMVILLDDTYIYLQYDRNIANGGSIAFNSGEPGYGIISPLKIIYSWEGYSIYSNKIALM